MFGSTNRYGAHFTDDNDVKRVKKIAATLTDVDAISERLSHIRDDGYSITRAELDPDVEGRQRRQVDVAGPAQRAREAEPVQQPEAEHDRQPVADFAAQRGLEPALADVTPRADDVGPDLDVHEVRG